jgi:hypothetical protein
VTAGAVTGDPEAQVAAALEALRVEPPGAYRWLGRHVDCAADVPGAGRSVVLERLEEDLYRDFYCAGGEPRALPRERSAPAIRAAFRERLADANTATTTWARGWVVTSVHGDAVCVERNGLQVFVRSEDMRLDREPIEPGRRVSIALPADLLGVAPGHYVATGSAGDAGDVDPRAVRVYFHPSADAATELVARLSQRLNRDALPFRLKVLDDPLGFVRCDAAVLLVPRRMFDGIAPALRWVVRDLEAHLQPATPALTKALAPGVALAEDPDWKGESFGAHRCRIIAEAALEVGAGADGPLAAPIDAVRAAFARHGLRLDAPYLNAGSLDDYRL